MFFPLTLCAQSHSSNLAFAANVVDEQGKPVSKANVRVIVKKGVFTGTVPYEGKTNLFGWFQCFIDYDRDADLIISKTGYQPVYIRFNTYGVPANERPWGYEMGGFRIVLDRGDHNASPREIINVFFSEEIKNFDAEKR